MDGVLGVYVGSGVQHCLLWHIEGELHAGTALPACCSFDSAVNKWQVYAGVRLLVCALEVFLGEAGVSRKHRGWR